VSEDIRNLSEGERVEHIADILCRAIQAGAPAVTEENVRPSEADPRRESASVDLSARFLSDDDRVIRYISRVGEASPAALRAILRLPKTSAYRVLNRLSDSGQIVSAGQTRSLVYRLGSLPPHGQNVELN